MFYCVSYRSSKPGHEYIEADYECEIGYIMSSKVSRLLCRERHWLGKLPVCKYRGDEQNNCADMNCEQLCNVVNGRAECQCHEGYRADGHKCFGRF